MKTYIAQVLGLEKNVKLLGKHSYPHSKIVSEYDQEIPQSQTADNPVAPRGRAY